MINVNLLPWREEARKQHNMQFMCCIGVACIILLLTMLISHMWVHANIASQLTRNQFLRQQITSLNSEVKPLRSKAKKYSELHDRYNHWMSLQSERFQVIAMLNELPKVIPIGVSLHEITIEGDRIILQGEARSHYKVADMMSRIDRSTVFDTPDLTEVALADSSDKAKNSMKNEQVQAFILKLHQEKITGKTSNARGKKA